MRFSIGGCTVQISVPFLAILCLLLYCDRTGQMPITLLLVALHEMGHVFALLACGQHPKALRLRVGAVELVRPKTMLSLAKECAISLAGPLTNFVVGGLLLFCSPNAAGISFCLGVSNLLPVPGLDGGTLLELLAGGRRWLLILAYGLTGSGILAAAIFLYFYGSGGWEPLLGIVYFLILFLLMFGILK